MSRKKTERQLNLVICLLDTPRYLTVQEIRDTVPGYDSDSEEAFRRMFERDKDELRELGIPLETGGEGDAGYRIARRDYELPEIVLEADEAAAIGLAARLWDAAPLAGATGSALLKLRAAGAEPTDGGALAARIETAEPAFEAAWQATRDGRPIRFSYHTPGREAPQERDVEPWGIVSWRGRWYLVGHDRDRDAERVFRLSRIIGEVSPYGDPGTVERPAQVDLRATVERMAVPPPTTTARVRVRVGTCGGLRRDVRSSTANGDGWEELEVGYSNEHRLAVQVAQYGTDAVALSPASVRDAVVQHLTAILEAS